MVTPKGYFDASLGAMGLLYYVDGLDIIPLEAYFEKSYIPTLFKSIDEGREIGGASDKGDRFTNIMVPPTVKLSSPMLPLLSANPRNRWKLRFMLREVELMNLDCIKMASL
ncbi:MAG: hypothetical protein IPN18_18690 [Ignavibacteriales bacterium]|nr:hypothetical protein [Ignavibacteriales bacterium]